MTLESCRMFLKLSTNPNEKPDRVSGPRWKAMVSQVKQIENDEMIRTNTHPRPTSGPKWLGIMALVSILGLMFVLFK